MSEPIIARRKPCLETVQAGKKYFWCSCGRSAKQPFCDGSHKGTEFSPVAFVAQADGEVLFCACKHTRTQPVCDGSHNNLAEKYEEAKADAPNAPVVQYETAAGGALKAQLDNDCYVVRVPPEAMQRKGNMAIYPVISGRDNARFLSQFSAIINQGTSPVLRFPGSDTVLFVLSGRASIRIADRQFAVGPESGVCVKVGEAFSVSNDHAEEPVLLNLSVCPECTDPEWLDEMPMVFDEAYAGRIAEVDQAKANRMADRFFQVLVDDKSHGTDVTQFIGQIPKSRAAHHRHLYEETITILSGEGFMWTDGSKAPVQPGDTIFLPLKQAHSLECTTEGGMRLVGVFYPSGSPAVNY
jgi:mannose-6-phosphate isomerase-like protein (cupin superfamily)/CDGSH-type Zn-finger protein